MKGLRYYCKTVLPKNHKTTNHGVKRPKPGIIKNNMFFRYSSFNQVVEHGDWFIVASVRVVTAHDDVIDLLIFKEQDC